MSDIYNDKYSYIIILNCLEEIIFCNKNFLNRLNYSSGEILNSNIKKIIISEKNIINQLDKENKTFHFLSKNNELIKVNFNISVEEFNNNECIFLIGKEITNEKSDNLFLEKSIYELLYKNCSKTVRENYLTEIKEISFNINKILTDVGQKMLNYTQADGISIFLYDNKKEGLKPILKLKNSSMYLENIDFIPLKKYELDSQKYKDYFNNIYLKNTAPNFSMIDYNDNNEVKYIGSYTIELNEELFGLVGLSFKNNTRPKINNNEYMKYNCNRIAMLIKNIILSNQVYIENKKRKYTERELENYLAVSVDLVAIVGKDGYFKKISPNWKNVLGWSEEELLSMPIVNIVHIEELESFKGRKKHEEIDQQITRHNIRFKHKDGHYVHLEWNSMYTKEEEIYITTSRDITKTIEIENEKKLLEKAMDAEIAKNEFFSNISHEFRTPINIILGTMQVVNKKIEKNNLEMDSLKKYGKYIKQNSYRLLRLANNLIDISKMDIGAYELRCSNQNIVNIIEEITLSVADYTKNNKINLIFDTSDEEIITYCDADKIERIMLNLLSNAIKYTPQNGFITVDITRDESNIRVSVKDSGMGIPKNKIDNIFDRFSQVDEFFNRKYEGSGIGLSLVKNLVEMHGGYIKVNSEINKGSEFIFAIPIKLGKEKECNNCEIDRKYKHVERCDIEFSDIYN